jgi:hypothetical protein
LVVAPHSGSVIAGVADKDELATGINLWNQVHWVVAEHH